MNYHKILTKCLECDVSSIREEIEKEIVTITKKNLNQTLKEVNEKANSWRHDGRILEFDKVYYYDCLKFILRSDFQKKEFLKQGVDFVLKLLCQEDIELSEAIKRFYDHWKTLETPYFHKNILDEWGWDYKEVLRVYSWGILSQWGGITEEVKRFAAQELLEYNCDRDTKEEAEERLLRLMGCASQYMHTKESLGVLFKKR